MKTKHVLIVIFAVGMTIEAMPSAEIAPILQLKVIATQALDSAITGELSVDKVFGGVEIAFDKNLAVELTAEYNSDNEGVDLNEAKLSYRLTDLFTISAGKILNNISSFESRAITSPLIHDYSETKKATVQFDLSGEKMFGGLAIYNGKISENFASVLPYIGFGREGIMDFRLSGRVEYLTGDYFADLAFGAFAAPVPKINFAGKFYMDLNEKPSSVETDSLSMYKRIGSMAEFDLLPNEKWLFFLRYDNLRDSKSVETLPTITTPMSVDESFTTKQQIQTGVGYMIAKRLRVGSSINANAIRTGSDQPEKEFRSHTAWHPSISADIGFKW